jgi:hypothetical protein
MGFGSGSEIQESEQTHPSSWIQGVQKNRITDPGFSIPDPGYRIPIPDQQH